MQKHMDAFNAERSGALLGLSSLLRFAADYKDWPVMGEKKCCRLNCLGVVERTMVYLQVVPRVSGSGSLCDFGCSCKQVHPNIAFDTSLPVNQSC